MRRISAIVDLPPDPLQVNAVRSHRIQVPFVGRGTKEVRISCVRRRDLQSRIAKSGLLVVPGGTHSAD
jgi:hypothetical protein